VIDELDMVLRELFGVDVIMATTTGTNLDGELYEGYTELRNISKYLSKIFSKYLSKIF
jgi:hypothetical protein